MLLLIPVFLLLSTAIAIQIWGRVRFNTIQTWILTLVCVITAWVSFIGLRVLDPSGWTAGYIKTNTTQEIQIIFQFTPTTWVFAFLLITLSIAVVLADSSRLLGKNNLAAWTGTTVITAFAVIACMSGSLVAFLLASSLLDIALFMVQVSTQRQSSQLNTSIFELAMRIIGSFVLMAGLGSQEPVGVNLISQIAGDRSQYIFIGLALRIGVLSIGDKLPSATSIRRNLNALIAIVVPVTTFAFISRLPQFTVQNSLQNILVGLILILTLAFILRLFSTTDQFGSKNPWIGVCSGAGLILFVINRGNEILPLGIALLVIASVMTITEYTSKKIRFIIAFLLIGTLGLPFSPTFGIWVIPDEKTLIFTLLYDLILLISIVRAVVIIIQNHLNKSENEKWVELSNDLIPLILITSAWIFLPWNNVSSGEWIDLVLPGVVIIITVFWLLISAKVIKFGVFTRKHLPNTIPGRQVFIKFVKDFFQFRWLVSTLIFFYNILSVLVKGIVRMLEGDGGLLWALVCLILLTTVIASYRFFS